jgi:MurNAc alpha-1-phosphate uridylyltransferase
MKAMILAAGRGERLRPLTDTIPKPLIEIKGKALICHHIENLIAQGINEIVINLHHLPEKIQHALGDGSQFGIKIHYSHEAELLEWSGGILQALPLLGPTPFILINADIFCDYPLNLLPVTLDHNLAHLIMVPNPPEKSGDFGLIDQLTHPQLQIISLDKEPKFTYAGMAVIAPELFAGMQPGRKGFRELVSPYIQQELISGELYSGIWFDIGTPERLAILRGKGF